ncbi:mucin-12-like isoform X2 [Odontomachus brunneus]|uniref:mucin-12-like isoform X2 n=1 Tax=Odontomachus brunneus TaxID=486640 RepID=UPI0013F1B965|nr:mucin-12-like isoform X2 [Odontomachus brunneus]XP_032666000.1 mucin-12-like isoform X2 [Odontomachus brunneus]
MTMRSTGLSRWLLLAGLLCCSSCQSVPSFFENKPGQNFSRPRVFSPRMDYDEWTPLGRGDPLKNNPTFDYVPPVLDRVQYWLDSHTTEPSSKRDILVLGVTAKKTSPKIPEQFLQFVDGPKFTRAGQDASYRNEFTGSNGAEPPKIVRTTSFRNGLIDYRNQNRLQSLPASYYPSPYYGQKMKPYTMMMPPPMTQKAETSTSYNAGVSKDKVIGYADTSQPFNTQTEEGPLLQDAQYHVAPSKDYGYYSPASSSRPYSTSKTPANKGVSISQVETIKSIYAPTASQSTRSKYEATTAPSVSFEKSNLIYQSTQTLSGGWLNNNGPTSSSSTGFPDSNQVTWQTPDYSKDHYEVDYHTAASSNHEVVVGQNANIIVDGNSNENEEVVVGQKEVSTEAMSSTSESVVQTSTATSTITMDSADQEGERGQTEETVTETQTSQKMHIVLANSPSTISNLETHQAKKGPVTVVMPTNYVEKNSSSSSSDSLTTLHNSLTNPITSEMTKTTHQTPKAQSQTTRNTVTSLPIVENRPSVTPVLTKMMPPSQLPHQPPHPPSAPVMPVRHVGGPLHIFVPPQAASQSMMHPQSRPNHAMMHFIGSMRPGFRPSSSMSHMSPPMAHMHAPAMKTMMGPPPSVEQSHQRPPQPYPVTFTSPPSPTTISMQTTESEQSIDHRPSRLLATVTNSMTTSAAPFIPTVPSTMEYASTVNIDHKENIKLQNQTPLMKILNTEETSKTKPTLAPSSTTSPRTTTVPSLTTDPIFSHYKQPDKPISGPMYHIIQGHSKVKTYKPTLVKHSLPVENNEVVESITKRQMSKLEQLIWQNTKNGATDPAAEKRKLEEKARAEKRVPLQQHDNLMSLVESGLEGFTVSPSNPAVTEDERRANSVTSVEIN